MVYTNLKNTAIALRKEGMSYSEIKEKIPVSKATLSKWFKEIKLSPAQRSHLKQKRTEAAKRGSVKKIEQTLKAIEEVEKNSSRDIGKISKRELWLMGVVLYWKNKNQNDVKKGVSFSSSDPSIIKLFLRWLSDSGGLKREEILFDIFITKSSHSEEDNKDLNQELKNKIIDHWSQVTGFSKDYFSHIYFYSKRRKKGSRTISKKTETGILRVRVRASSMLARQISGWIRGLENYFTY